MLDTASLAQEMDAWKTIFHRPPTAPTAGKNYFHHHATTMKARGISLGDVDGIDNLLAGSKYQSQNSYLRRTLMQFQ